MIRRILLGLVLVVCSSASFAQAVGSFVDPVWRQAFNGVYKTGVQQFCDYKATYAGATKTCINARVASTATNNFTQSWAWTLREVGKADVNETTTAQAYCDPAFFTGPALNNGKYMCKVVNPPPDTNICLDANPFIRKWSYGKAIPPYAMPTCAQGCKIVVDEVLDCRKETVTGVTSTYCMMQVHRTGEHCLETPTPEAPSSPPDVGPDDKANPKTEMPPTAEPRGKCPAGSVQGGVDSRGTPICIGTGTNPPEAPKPKPSIETSKTEAMPDGSTKTTTTKTTTNADGSTTTNTTVTIQQPDGSTTTNNGTSTSTKPDGSAGVNDKAPEDEKYDLCKQNPMLAMCRNSSVSGTCGEITCQGDAIQCATLRAAAALQCEQQADKDALKASPLTTLGNSALAGNDPLKDSLPTPAGASVVNMPGSVDAEGWLGGGSCFADKSITVQGHVITIPLSQSCDILLVLRYALMVVASLVSFRIVSGAVLT